MIYNVESLRNPNVVEADEPANRPWWRSRWCRIFSISFTCTGFLLGFASALYCLLLERYMYIYFLIAAVICLTVFVHLVTAEDPYFPNRRPLRAVPVEVTTPECFRALLRRSHGDREPGFASESSDSVPSLPGYILIPAERQEPDESCRASTESTLSADSSLERRQEEEELLQSPTKKQDLSDQLATKGSCSATKLSEAAAMISQIAKDSLVDMEDKPNSETKPTEQSSEKNSENEGVRQRKQSPMETQEYISLVNEGKAT